MKNTGQCPKCGSRGIIRVPDHPMRHASGNNIYTSRLTLAKKVPVIRYVCARCGYTENWADTPGQLDELRRAFG